MEFRSKDISFEKILRCVIGEFEVVEILWLFKPSFDQIQQFFCTLSQFSKEMVIDLWRSEKMAWEKMSAVALGAQ